MRHKERLASNNLNEFFQVIAGKLLLLNQGELLPADSYLSYFYSERIKPNCSEREFKFEFPIAANNFRHIYLHCFE
jgi:hypothetical protein